MSTNADLENVEVRHEKGYVAVNPLVSIVVCCYNRRHLLEKTMESIFIQRYEPVEIVVVDDGSTDNTDELISRYGDKVRYYWQENQGITAARNAGCRLARGEYIAFQDDDDLMPPYRIIQLYKALQLYPSTVLAFGDWAVIDLEGKLTGEQSHFDIPAKNGEPLFIEDGYTAIMWGGRVTPLTHTSLFRRADGERINWFDPRFFHACEDTEFFARLGKLGPIVYVPKVMSYYRKGHSSLMNNPLLSAYSRFLFLEKHLKVIKPDQEDLRRRLQYRMLHILKQIAFLQKRRNGTTSIPEDCLDRGLSLLGLKERFLYNLYTLTKP